MTTELTNEQLLLTTPEDYVYYSKCIEGLPTRDGKNGDTLDKYGVPIPYGSGPHILPHFRDTISIVNPKAILEIGFNYGTSSSFWLNLCDAKVVSTDISDKDETVDAARILKERFGYRFDFYFRNELPMAPDTFDLIFIDGGHDYKDVFIDIKLAKDLRIPYLLFDDIYSRFGPGVIPAISEYPELELVHDMNNLRLYKWKKH